MAASNSIAARRWILMGISGTPKERLLNYVGPDAAPALAPIDPDALIIRGFPVPCKPSPVSQPAGTRSSVSAGVASCVDVRAALRRVVTIAASIPEAAADSPASS